MLNKSFLNDSFNCCKCNDRSCAAMSLSETELSILDKNCSESRFKKGDVILAEGSLTSHIIYLKSGLVKEYLKNGPQQEYILQIVKSHSYLGLHSIFSDRFNHYSYSALTDVVVCFIDINTFNKFVKENNRFSYNILESISSDSLNNYFRFINQNQKKIYGKLADALLYFSRNIFESNSFQLPLNRTEISYLIGVSRESVTKQLKKFELENLVSFEENNITITDIERLERISRNG